jgi:hypothetical protein
MAALLGLACIVIVAAVTMERQAPRQPLTHVYTPAFRPIPPPQPAGATVSGLWNHLLTPRGAEFLRSILPGESGVLWLSLVIVLLVGFDFERLDNPRNLDLIAMQAIGFCLFGILRFLDALQTPEFVQLMDWIFAAIVFLNLFLVGRVLWRVDRPVGGGWRPVLGHRPLAAVALVLLVCNVMIALLREPDDVGFFVNLGAQRLRERGALPYGDPLLTGSPGAAYGPLLYAAHVPFQLALAPQPVNVDSPDHPPLGSESTYYLPPALATKLCTIAFHLLGIAALFFVARGLAGSATAWAVVVLYAGSAYVLGVGGANYFIGGMTYISHIAPPAMTLCAFAFLSRPMTAGVLLALAAGVGFYPAFMAPAWLGYYWNRPRERWSFLGGFVPTAAAIGGAVLLLSRPAGGRGLIGTILWDTFGHHTDPRGYGASPFGFWGQRAGIRGWLMNPLIGESGFTTPVFLLFLALVLACFWKARGKQPQQLALLTAAVAIAASLLKIHPTGTYVAWYYPFLLLGLFA